MTSQQVETSTTIDERHLVEPTVAAYAAIEDEGFILLKDICAIVPLHPQSIRRLAKNGCFPALLKIGGRSAVRRRDLREWLRRQA